MNIPHFAGRKFPTPEAYGASAEPNQRTGESRFADILAWIRQTAGNALMRAPEAITIPGWCNW
jgi:hypothetical protein